MKIYFGSEKLESLTPKFLLAFFNYITDSKLHNSKAQISNVQNIPQVYAPKNTETIITIWDITREEEYCLFCLHANDMSCSSWKLVKQDKYEVEIPSCSPAGEPC